MRHFFCIFAAVLFCFSCSSVKSAPEPVNMIADLDPVQVGSVNASIDQTLSPNLRERTIEVFFHPRENLVGLDFNHEFSQSWQYWDEGARQSFIESVLRYNEDLSNNKLINDYGKTRKIYGTVKGRAEWVSLSMFTFSEKYRASPVIELGYRFRGNKPYFSTCQRTAKEESGVNKDIKESWQFNLYFTSEQCKELAKIFDQAFLLESIGK